MTWLGKILTIVIFLGALVWAFFTVQNYVLRTNWKTEYDKYKAAYKEASTKRQEDYNRHIAAEELLRRQLAYEQTRTASLSKTVESLSASAKKAGNDFTVLQTEFQKGDINAVKSQANITALNSELSGVRKRNGELEDNAVNLTVAAEKAKAEMVRAQNSERLAQAIASDNAKKVEDLQGRVSELRAARRWNWGRRPSAGNRQAAAARSFQPARRGPGCRGRPLDHQHRHRCRSGGGDGSGDRPHRRWAPLSRHGESDRRVQPLPEAGGGQVHAGQRQAALALAARGTASQGGPSPRAE